MPRRAAARILRRLVSMAHPDTPGAFTQWPLPTAWRLHPSAYPTSAYPCHRHARRTSPRHTATPTPVYCLSGDHAAAALSLGGVLSTWWIPAASTSPTRAHAQEGATAESSTSMGELTSPKRVQEALFFTPLPTQRLLPAAESPESVSVLGDYMLVW